MTPAQFAAARRAYRAMVSEVSNMDSEALLEIQTMASRWLSTETTYQEATAEIEQFAARVHSRRDQGTGR